MNILKRIKSVNTNEKLNLNNIYFLVDLKMPKERYVLSIQKNFQKIWWKKIMKKYFLLLE